MPSEFLPYAVPDIGEEEIQEVIHALRSGWVTTGPKTRQFESEFREFLSDDLECISVNSATAGLHLALEAVGIAEGDEVIVPSYTFTATAEVVRYLGATPIIVECDSGTFNIAPDAIEAAITPRTRAIIPVHFAGLSCDMNAIIAIAKKNNLKIIEDAAHALPATWQGRLIGTLDTDATVFSFYANKTMTTGEGGMVVTRHTDIAKRCRVMRLHGISRDAFDRYTSRTPAWKYEVIAPGFKYNLGDIASAIGIQQLKKLTLFQQTRERMARVYDEELRELPITLPPRPQMGDIHAYHLYPVLLNRDAPISRDALIQKLSEMNIGTSVHFIPLHLHPYWRDKYSLKPENFPISTDLFEREISIPLFTRMTESDQARVIEALRKLLA